MPKNHFTERNWPDNMRPAVAADYLSISDSKLAKLRMAANRKYSPSFVKVSGCVIYRRKDLDDWLERHVVRSGFDKDSGAFDPGGGTALSLKPIAPSARPHRAQRLLAKK